MAQKLKVGDEFKAPFRLTQDDVERFMTLSGDRNQIHFDADAAGRSVIGRVAVPGMLSALAFTRVLGTQFPGHRTVYRSQTLEFLRPMFVETDYIVEVTVRELEPPKHRGRLTTVVREAETGEVTLRGEAVVIHLDLL